MAKAGPAAAIKMQKFSNDYADVMDDTQASYSASKKDKKKGAPPSSLQIPNDPNGMKVDPPKRRRNRNRSRENQTLTGAYNSNGLPGAITKLLGKSAYRLGQKLRARKMTEEQLDEVAFLAPLAGVAAKVGTAAAGLAARAAGSKIGKRLIRNYLRNKVRNRRGRGNDNNNGNGGGGSNRKPLDVQRSPTGGPARLNPKVDTRPFDTDRITRTNKSWVKDSNTPQTRQQTNESIEVNLDGNTFHLNRIAATKVQNVYESLNKKNKKKMNGMMNESTESLNKIISFALRQ
jgi:hypothetical protein